MMGFNLLKRNARRERQNGRRLNPSWHFKLTDFNEQLLSSYASCMQDTFARAAH